MQFFQRDIFLRRKTATRVVSDHDTDRSEPFLEPTVDRYHNHSPGMDSDDSARSSIYIEEDLKLLQQVTLESTIPFVPNIRYGKVLSIEDGRTLTVASRIYNGYTTVLSPQTYRFQLVIAGIEPNDPKDTNDPDPASVVLRQILMDQIVYIPHIDIEPATGQLHAQIYIGQVHLNRWMMDQGLVKATTKATTKAKS
jgi:hypothetical protein